MRLTALAIVLAATALAQAPEPARIEGRVLVKDSTTPVPRAEIQLSGKTATSGDDGRFVLEVAPGVALGTLAAKKTGFLEGGASPEATTISLSPGATLKDATIYLLPQAVISGRITDSQGNPAAGVQALLLQQGFRQGWPQRRWDIRGSAQADATGAFRIANLRPGRYFLLAFRRQPRAIPTGTAAEVEDVATFYANSASLSAAIAIDVAAGQEAQGIQIQMRRERVYTFSGKLSAQEVSPKAQISVTPEDTELPMGFFGQPVPVRADGSFEVRGLLPGRYSVTAYDQVGAQPGIVSLASIAITDQNISNYVMPSQGGVTLRGVIELEGGDLQPLLPPYDPAAKPMLVIPEEQMPRWAILFERDDKLFPYFDAYIQADGSFRFQDALPFPARLAVAPPKGLYVKSATMGGQDLFRNELNPAFGGDIRVTLAKGAGSAAIQVPSPCIAVLWSEQPVLGLSGIDVKAVEVKSGTSATFADLRPGRYSLAAFRGIDMALAQNRPFLDLLTAEAVKLEVPVNGQASAAAPLIPDAKIRAAEQKVP